MDTDLLATKLLVPPPIRHAVPRGRLCHALDRGVPEVRLTIVSTPPGYGKTTLLAQWARDSALPVVWLTVSPGDNDADRFFRYLLNAWETVRPHIRKTPLGLLLSGTSPPIDDVLAAIVQTATDCPEHTAFVLDDVHLIDDPAIHAALNFLLDHLPSTLHLILAGRRDPPLSLARHRARCELLELRAEDLQFDVSETTIFLKEGMGLDLSSDDVTSLQTQLEGWITGLQLVALTLRHRPDPGERLLISGRHRHVADYLGEEVLAHLPEPMRTFMLQTSILDRVNGSLCAAVTGNPQSQAMLEELERSNLFLVPLDDSRSWFRYHRVFADFLRRDLERHLPGEITGLHRRAAAWYLEHELPEQAFQHAMDGRHADLVIDVFDRYSTVKMFSGEMRVVRQWLDALPSNWIVTYPKLGLAEAAYLVLTGQTEASLRRLDQIEQQALTTDADVNGSLARVTATRCFVACFANDLSRAVTYANEALRDLPAEDAGYRADVHHALGDTYRGNGRWAEARESYLRVLDYVQDVAFAIRSGHVFGALADLELRQGHLKNAAGYWTRALAKIEDRQLWGRFPLPVAGWVYLRMGELFYERNDLEQARGHVSRGFDRAGLGGDARAMIAGHVIVARMELTDGDIESAAAHLEQAHLLLETAPFPEWTGRFERCRVDLWLAQDKVKSATDWSDLVPDDTTLGSQAAAESTQLAVTRVLIHTGDPEALARAEDILGRLIVGADELGQLGVVIEGLALRALAHAKRHDRTAALTDLERALRLAEPEGYVRLFVDLGLPMAWLLQEAGRRGVMPAYVARLLAACGADPAVAQGARPSLVEPISPRERDVLRLVAAGLTNREIAASLFLSPETIKKHTANIYAKLGVRGRVEAVTRARSLAIID